MFRRVNNRRDVLAHIYRKIGFEDILDVQDIHISCNFSLSGVNPSLTAYYLLRAKGFSDEASNKIVFSCIHDNSRAALIFFNMERKKVVYRNVAMRIKSPRQLWRFRQRIFKRGDNPEILMFIEGTNKGYLTNKKEGIERAWRLLTNEL